MMIVEYQNSLQSAYYPMTTLTGQTYFLACTNLVGLASPLSVTATRLDHLDESEMLHSDLQTQLIPDWASYPHHSKSK